MGEFFSWLSSLSVYEWEELLLVALPALFVILLAAIWIVLLVRYVKRKSGRQDTRT